MTLLALFSIHFARALTLAVLRLEYLPLRMGKERRGRES